MPETIKGDEIEGAEVRIAASLTVKLNLADYQNAVPSLRELSVFNGTAKPLEHLELSASSSPSFFKPKTWHIDAIGPQQTRHITSLDLQLDGPLLSRLTESESARITFALVAAGQIENPLARCEHDLELLPRNQWGGLSHLPEMIAAFVQPNDPAIDKLLKQAAELLRKGDRNPALNGYDDGTRHAWEIAAAIWAAVGTRKLDYALPPASFEQSGQKIRGPAQLLDSGLGTCLDLSLLFAAALEQAGLHPLLVFTTGHSFAGCWLRREEFATAFVDDPAALSKRLLLKELVLFETTLTTSRPVPAFSTAAAHGAKHLAEDSTSQFEAAIDVHRARMHRIRPLALAEAIAPVPSNVPAGEAMPVELEEAPDLPEDEDARREPDPSALGPADRVARWQRKLLDLSLRNSLLNFRKNKRAVVFEAPDPGRLEDVLATGQALRVRPQPALMDGADPRSRALHEERAHDDVRAQHAREGLEKHEVFSKTAGEAELESTLVELYRSARSSIEEGGANTLFLVLGFLSWAQEGKGLNYKAPLILIPVTLNRHSVRSGFTLTLHEDEPQFNPTLVEMLRQDFELELGLPESDLPRDDSGLDVAGIWMRVSEAVKDIKGWEVTRDVVLSTFSFAKHLMWKDLVHRTDQLRENPVVRHLIDNPRDAYESDVRFVDPASLDSDFEPRETFSPLAADSSQLAAVMSASRGKDFVLIGPPGTGKSQTIANLIAHSVASGKRVLFVAEKIAALDVVHRRLREVGLGTFCLEIHSSKARKTSVLDALGGAWNARGAAEPGVWEEKAQRLKALRDSLNQYVKRLHLTRPNGLTAYAALGRVVSGTDVPEINISWQSPSGHDGPCMSVFRDAIHKLETHALAVGASELARSPLGIVGQSEWSPLWQAGFGQQVKDVQLRASATRDAYLRLAGHTRLPVASSLTASVRAAVQAFANGVSTCIGRSWAFSAAPEASEIAGQLRVAVRDLGEYRHCLSQSGGAWTENVLAAARNGLRLLQEAGQLQPAVPAPWPRDILSRLEHGKQILVQLADLEKQLSVRYGPTVSQLDAAGLEREWQRAEKSIWPVSSLAKKKVTAALLAFAPGGGEPDPAKDLPVLSEMGRLRAEVEAIDLRVLPPEIWAGLRTNVEAAQVGFRLQEAVTAAQEGRDWDNCGFELIASGLCGPLLRQTYETIRRLATMRAELASLDWLSLPTEGLWRGLATDRDLLSAGIAFCDDVRDGRMDCSHEAVARGACGKLLLAEHSRLQQLAQQESAIAGHVSLAGKTDGLWRGTDTDAEEVNQALAFHELLEETIPAMSIDTVEQQAIRAAVNRLCRTSAGAETIQDVTSAFGAALVAYSAAISSMSESGCIADVDRERLFLVTPEDVHSQCAALLENAPRLQRWCAWRKARIGALALGLDGFVAALEGGIVSPPALADAFEVNYSRWWLNHVVGEDTVLRTFVSTEHEKLIGEFQRLDEHYTSLTREWIRAKLCAAMPSTECVAPNAEWGLLRRELAKKKRHLPLRELMGRIPSVVTALTPCLLMSPLSIAQYLAVSTAAFEVVVFDEASQITVWDAIGAIARAKQVVMVGDPKQLPPTNFFNRTETEEDLGDVPEDLESILDECLGAGLPAVQLSWHYRSRHESLIAFSNRRYYGGELVTFPSPVTEDRAVSFHYVRGVYERGGARTNPDEARAVVRDLVARLKAQGFGESRLSIGVVTFNIEQQKLIADLLDAERRKDPSIEPHFADDCFERVFVKNLESVQGDERDIMYFSVTYGPDSAGRPSANFGPMNRDGGERRLNVAITRARRELRVFSSLRPEQIDLSRTQATGVAELKYFLEFAERGPRAFAEIVSRSSGAFESPFEESVARALESRGWTTHSQIGVSSFRIDLGIVHPDAPGVYLAGVECDGATYHRSATARDRDKLRQQVLKGLGWEMLRVWSTDWWIDRESTLNRLTDNLDALLTSSRSQRAEARRSEVAIPIEEGPDVPGENTSLHSIENGVYCGSANQADAGPDASTGTAPEVASDPERFYERSYDGQLAAMIANIVETEGPVLDEVIARKIARMHGWQRTGNRITERVTKIAVRSFRKTHEDERTFFWPRACAANQPVPFRVGKDRSVEEICIQELVSVALDILRTGESGEEAINAMAKAIGLQRMRAPSRSRLQSALSRAHRRLRQEEQSDSSSSATGARPDPAE